MIRKPPLFLFALGVWILAEICVFALVVQLIGWFGAIILGLATTLIGVGILRKLGQGAAHSIKLAMNGGHIPGGRMLDGLLTALGAVLLIVPGFMSDIAGLVLAAPSARQWLATRFGGGDDAKRAKRPDIIDLSPEDWSSLEKPAARASHRLDPTTQLRP